jgi:nitroreductase/NAD-dependent dihydropyrimidine dehydrogenase PreA subunit
MKQSIIEKITHAHMPPTLFYRFEYDPEKCTQCMACYQTCPTSCIQWDAENKRPYATGLNGIELACIGCNNCEAVCPGQCIHMRGEYRVLKGRYKTPEEKFGEMTPPMPFGEKDKERSFEAILKDLTETEAIIFKRRSIRLYKDKPVPEEYIRRILEAARFAPSAGNGQPFKLIVVTDRETNRKVDQASAKVLYMIKNLYAKKSRWRKFVVTMLSLIDANKWDQRPIAAMEKVRQTDGSITFDAPVVIHILKDKRGISNPDIDVGIGAANMVMAAHALGLGTCYIGFIASTAAYAPAIKKMLNIDYPYELALSLCVGYSKIKYDNPVCRGPVPVAWIKGG